MNTQFRYSPEFWPNAPLPVPRIAVSGTVTLTDDGWLIPSSGITLTEPPHEMHLRELADTDMRDAEAVLALTRTVGPLLDYGQPWVGVSDPATLPKYAKANYHREVAHIAHRLGMPTPKWKARPVGATHISEAAGRLLLLEQLRSHVACALAQKATAPVWQSIGFFDLDDEFDFPDERPLGAEDPEILAWWFFAQMLNEGLTSLSPRIVPPEPVSEPDMGDVKDAFAAACVLIFNDILEDIPYKRCADETCGRTFKHQSGRSSGSYSRSTGVAYCSALHARNQAQRERRRRDRAERPR